MKRKFSLFIAFLAVMLFAAGCSFNAARRTSHLDSSSQFSGKVLNYAIEPSIEVDGPATATAEYTRFLGFWIEGEKGVMAGFNWEAATVGANPADRRLRSPLLVAVRDQATYLACKKSGADFLVAPKYDILVKNYFFYKYIRVTVTGFAGRYKNFKVLPTEEAQKRLRDEAITRAINKGAFGNTKIEIPLDAIKIK